MKKFVPNKIEELNLPSFCRNTKCIKENQIYIYTDDNEVSNYIEIVPQIFVPESLTNIFTVEYFLTDITNKSVYVPLHLYGGYLPVSRQTPFQVYELDKNITEYNGFQYKKVEFTDETTLEELYKNAVYYQYNANTDTFLRLPESGMLQNKIKFIMEKNLMEIGGDAFDRIADYGRLILFLVAKVYPTFTDEEKQVFQDLIKYTPEIESLTALLNRECLIQDEVKQAKENPLKYIGLEK